ncbi:Male sterility protein [Popillia japonica]|uniref:Fatty acyl-CoA reductase n=1 Tax=Popillia japonica TaxID=7064 RepID=A0AAW1LXZ3_POPJA
MDDIEALPDRIFDNYYNTTIFITGGTGFLGKRSTGGTGFLGKVIIERLLRVFDVKKIYILIRDRKGQIPSARLQNLFSSPLFDKVRSLKGAEIFEKCKAIAGEVAKDHLGLNDEDREILQKEVEYVIHSAATVRFDEPLRKAILINTKGAVSMIGLAKEMANLKLFIHVSTAYCHPEENVLKETTYRAKYNYEHMISLANWFDEGTLESVRSGFMAGIPNTYTFSKALGEDAVASVMDTLPIVIMRPTIITPIWKEPLPGWTDNVNGIVGMFLAFGKGILRTMPAEPNIALDLITVDVVIVGMFLAFGKGILRTMPAEPNIALDLITVDVVADNILALGAYSLQNGMPSRVFNISSHNYFSERCIVFFEKCKQIITERAPFETFLWIPSITLTNSKFVYYFLVVICQLLPSLIIDRLLPLFGHKPFLWRTQMRILDSLNILQYYLENTWTFENHCIAKCEAWMNAKEFHKYTLTHYGIDLNEYLIQLFLGTKRYILKEPDVILPKTKRLMRIMVWANQILGIILKLFVSYFFYRMVLLRIFNYIVRFCVKNI